MSEMVRPPKIHNGKYTIQSPTGAHRTFRIETQAEDAAFAPGKRIISLMDGTSNEFSFSGFGFLDDAGIALWRSKRSKETETYAEMVWSLTLDGAASVWAERGFRLLIEGACLVCNRPLTTPESIKTGIGPTCAKGRKPKKTARTEAHTHSCRCVNTIDHSGDLRCELPLKLEECYECDRIAHAASNPGDIVRYSNRLDGREDFHADG